MCLFLMGGGRTRDALLDLQPVFNEWWNTGVVLPMRIATLTPGLDSYMEEPGGPIGWDTFIVGEFVPLLRSQYGFARCAIVGILAGGYGALKIAFAKPGMFDAVAAMQPMLEPGLRESDVRPRNRLHHAAGRPDRLVGAKRDAALWESNNPSNRVLAHIQEIRDAGLGLYLEAADNDFLNTHDGAEFLHRVLWQQDISHEYRLVRGAEYGGPSMRPRLAAMFSWVSAWRKPVIDSAAEEKATQWLEGGMQGKPPARATNTDAFVQFLRSGFEPLRAQTAQLDPTTNRRYGELLSCCSECRMIVACRATVNHVGPHVRYR